MTISTIRAPIYVVSDVHLSQRQPAITAGFLQFLQLLPDNAQLYILGDLFDYWVGDDAVTLWHQELAKSFADLSKRGVQAYFIHGNRDFMLSTNYADQCLFKLFDEYVVIDNNKDNNSNKIVLLHGDQLCTDDKNYQLFRKVMRNRFLQKLFLRLPLSFRNKIGGEIRKTSKEKNQIKPAYQFDINQDAVQQFLDKTSSTIMVHGHIHHAQHFTFSCKAESCERWVLGTWNQSKGSYLVIDPNNEIELKTFVY